MPTIELEFAKKKDTKNCAVFEELDRAGQPIVVGSLYVKKFAAGSAEKVKVTLEVQ